MHYFSNSSRVGEYVVELFFTSPQNIYIYIIIYNKESASNSLLGLELR